MIAYLRGRLLQTVPVLFGISVIVFFLVRLIPGDPAVAALGSRATPQLIARVHDQLGLDLPLWRQYLNFLGHALRGDFGISFFYQSDVLSLTLARLPVTLALMGYTTLLSIVIATPIAFLAAAHRGGVADHLVRIAFTVALGTPIFWSGIMLAFWLGVRLRLLPIAGVGHGGADTLRHLTLPALSVALALCPLLVRTFRSSLIEVMASDYVTTGRAVGLAPWTVARTYVLRNSLRPVVSVISINVGYLIGGAVIAEQIFSLPGIGALLISSIATRDYAVIQLATLCFALLVVLVNLLADVLYAVIDPRVALA